MVRNTATGISLKTSGPLVVVWFNVRVSILERSMTVNKRDGVRPLKFLSMYKHFRSKWLSSKLSRQRGEQPGRAQMII